MIQIKQSQYINYDERKIMKMQTKTVIVCVCMCVCVLFVSLKIINLIMWLLVKIIRMIFDASMWIVFQNFY